MLRRIEMDQHVRLADQLSKEGPTVAAALSQWAMAFVVAGLSAPRGVDEGRRDGGDSSALKLGRSITGVTRPGDC